MMNYTIRDAPITGRQPLLKQFLPQQADNSYHGYRTALWLFALLIVTKAAMGLNCIFNGTLVASRADGIPLDKFTSGAAQTVLSIFALWGLAQFMFSLLGLLVLVRYRSMVPFMFALLLLEHLSRKLILQFLPIERAGTPPGFYVNLALLAVMIAGLALSLLRRDHLSV